MLRRAALLLACLPQEGERAATVGAPARLAEVVLPGSELEVAPATPATPVVVRLAGVYPHGTDFRYDLEWYGLEPGTFDLTDFLRRRDGSPADGLPPLAVEVRSVLPAGQVEPAPLPPVDLPRAGGYATFLAVSGAAWLAGLAALLVAGRRRRRAAAARAAPPPTTLADRLRPLVERAAQGTLAPEERGRLELALIALWRRRLGLEGSDAAGALAALRSHPEAGPLLGSLEAWLHRPQPPERVDLAALLAPYRNLPADALGGI
jgi:hypothetical protein